jgi:hypothetical protein
MAFCPYGLLIGWLALYTRISAPINRALIAAASSGVVPPNARVLQRRWDSIIAIRAALQGSAVFALCLTLIS